MPADSSDVSDAIMPTLVETTEWVLNLTYLISAHKVGVPDRQSELDVTMLHGREVRFRAGDAATVLDRLRVLMRRSVTVGPVATIATPTKSHPRRVKPD